MMANLLPVESPRPSHSPCCCVCPSLLPSQQAPPLSSAQLRKNRDKLVALLEEGQLALLEPGEGRRRDSLEQRRDSLLGDEDLLAVDDEAPAVTTGRISIYCTATRCGRRGR